MEWLLSVLVYFIVGLFFALACVRFRLVKKQNVGVPFLLWPLCLGGVSVLLVIAISGVCIVAVFGTICNVVSSSRIGDCLWRLGGGEQQDG